jgi:hypothetical protein
MGLKNKNNSLPAGTILHYKYSKYAKPPKTGNNLSVFINTCRLAGQRFSKLLPTGPVIASIFFRKR